MNKFFKRIITFCLVITIVFSSLSLLGFKTDAASYKYDFIEALLENEDFWYNNWGPSVRYSSAITFIDLDFDGKLELIMQYGGGSMANCEADAFYFDGSKVCKADSDKKTANNKGFENGLTGYYDTVNKEYVLLGNSYFRMSAMEGWSGNFVLNYKSNSITTDYYSSMSFSSPIWEPKPTYTYYNGAKTYANSDGYSTISESQYNSINEAKLLNLVNINMRREYILCEDWEDYTYSEKYEALEWAYDGFTYDKFGEGKLGDVDGDDKVSVMDATAIQLHLASLSTIGDAHIGYADTDKDGSLSVMDATQIQLFLAHLIPEL